MSCYIFLTALSCAKHSFYCFVIVLMEFHDRHQRSSGRNMDPDTRNQLTPSLRTFNTMLAIVCLKIFRPSLSDKFACGMAWPELSLSACKSAFAQNETTLNATCKTQGMNALLCDTYSVSMSQSFLIRKKNDDLQVKSILQKGVILLTASLVFNFYTTGNVLPLEGAFLPHAVPIRFFGTHLRRKCVEHVLTLTL